MLRATLLNRKVGTRLLATVGIALASPASFANAAAVPSIAISTRVVAVSVSVPRAVLLPQSVNPHTPTTIPPSSTSVAASTGTCAVCHRSHSSNSARLLPTAGPESTLCFTCHDGTGANIDVSAQFLQANTQNDASTSSFYRHDATAQTSHSLAVSDEFSGIFNRHAECGDCHNPHQSHGTTQAQETNSGWTPSYRLQGISGVSVANAGAGSTPAYTFHAGNGDPISREYELCFKCHSGSTTLIPNDLAYPSRNMLDAAVEFNPANASFHPVESAGTNPDRNGAMTASLLGGNTWKFTPTSTVRCSNCHANGNLTLSSDPGVDLPLHVSQYRGLLLRNYADRVLTNPGFSASDGYAATNFTLCFLCHSDSPFVPGGTNDAATNFKTASLDLHRLHVAGIGNNPATNAVAGTSIDNAQGAGQGNALCAECHFRPHSTAFPAGGQARNTRLISFSPNVLQFGSGNTTPLFATSSTGGTCTLLCHGHQHNAVSYP
jgi:predicted CXXCH cytochrome family protein